MRTCPRPGPKRWLHSWRAIVSAGWSQSLPRRVARFRSCGPSRCVVVCFGRRTGAVCARARPHPCRRARAFRAGVQVFGRMRREGQGGASFVPGCGPWNATGTGADRAQRPGAAARCGSRFNRAEPGCAGSGTGYETGYTGSRPNASILQTRHAHCARRHGGPAYRSRARLRGGRGSSHACGVDPGCDGPQGSRFGLRPTRLGHGACGEAGRLSQPGGASCPHGGKCGRKRRPSCSARHRDGCGRAHP